ncbi:MAG: lipase family protein [Jatrophihabitans sp.]
MLQDKTFAGEESFAAIAIGIALGYTVVIPDYEGPHQEWTAGIEAGRGTLDGIRAAENFPPLGLPGAGTRVGMLGYSGGSQATEFAAELAPNYAPELNLVGAALGGLPVNIAHIAANVNGGIFAGIYFAAAFGIARAYPQINIDSLLNSNGKKLEQDIGGMCITQFAPTYAFQRIEQYTNNGLDPLSLPVIQQVAAADQMGVIGAPKIPMQVYMATHDGLVVNADVDSLVAKYCAAGTKIQYLKYPLAEHISAAIEGLPAALTYIQGRFAGLPAPATC